MLPSATMYLVLVLSIAGPAGYAWSTLGGRTQPNLVTWVLWCAIPLIMLLVQVDEKIGAEALYTVGASAGPALVVTASFVNRHAVWQLTRFDTVCGALALVALGVWIATEGSSNTFALAFAADVAAGLPTLRKAYSHPETESRGVYALGVVGGVLTLLAADTYTFTALALPVWILLLSLVLTVLITRPSWFGRSHSHALGPASK